MADLLVQLVDENDNPTRGGNKDEIFRDGLLHRIVRIMLFDEHGNILIQKRVPHARLFPGCWDNSAAGHVDEGEDYLVAGKRELKEELGLSTELAEAAYFRAYSEDGNKKLNRFTKIYTSTIPHDAKFILQPEEVVSVKWVTISELAKLVNEHPNSITDGLKQAFERLKLNENH